MVAEVVAAVRQELNMRLPLELSVRVVVDIFSSPERRHLLLDPVEQVTVELVAMEVARLQQQVVVVVQAESVQLERLQLEAQEAQGSKVPSPEVFTLAVVVAVLMVALDALLLAAQARVVLAVAVTED